MGTSDERVGTHWPGYRVAVPHIGPDVPDEVSNLLLSNGVPQYFLEHFTPLSETITLSIDGRAMVAIAKFGLDGLICVAAENGAVIDVPDPSITHVNRVNSSLPLFNECVSYVLGRFPFYSQEDEGDVGEVVAAELREGLRRIDATAMEDDGFWVNFCDDMAMFLFPTEEILADLRP